MFVRGLTLLRPGLRRDPRSGSGMTEGGRLEIGCWLISGVEAVSVPGPWAPAFAGATVWGMSWMALMGVGDDGMGVG